MEVGAGLGATSRFLCDGRQRSWTCLEPDPELLGQLHERLAAHPLPSPVRTICGTVDALAADKRFDAILYIDVLEHIEDDVAELERSAARLRQGGHIVVLAPAHQSLYSEFDKAIGHFRRYSKASLLAAAPPGASTRRGFLPRCGRHGRIAGQPSAASSIHAHRRPDQVLGSSARPRIARD